MSLSRAELDGLHDLAAALLDDTISPADFERFSDWLRRDVDARQFFASYVDLHCLLRRCAVGGGAETGRRLFPFPLPSAPGIESVDPSMHAGLTGESLAPPAPPLSSTTSFAPFSAGWLLHSIPFALAIILVIIATPLLVLGVRAATGIFDANLSSKFAARLTAVRNVRWADESAAPMSQSLLTEGQCLELRAGVAEVTFDAGPKVLLKGPAKFLIWSAECGQLHSGELTAQIPPAAVGFRIESPAVNVVGLGAEFGLIVSAAGEAEVHVLDGEVAAIFNDTASGGAVRRIDLKKSEAVHFNTDAGTLQRFVAAKDRFRGMVAVDEPLPVGKLWTANEGNWADPVNWTPTTLPGTAGHMGIGNGGRAVIDSAVDAGTLSLGWMRTPLKYYPEAHGHAEIMPGGSLLVRSGEACVGVRHSPNLTTLKISGGTLRVNPGGYLVVGDEPGSKGKTTIESGFLRLDEGDLRLGIEGSGSLEVHGGVISIGRRLRLAEAVSSVGQLAVVGSAAKIDVGDSLILGEKGRAELSFAIGRTGVSPIRVRKKTEISNGPREATLEVSLAGPAPQRDIVLIRTEGQDQVGGGRFAGLPDESTVTADFNGRTWSWQLSYDYDAETGADGSGNDVALKFVGISPVVAGKLQ